MSSSKEPHSGPMALEDLENIEITLMTLRKPTELKKVINSVPKPLRAVPKNGLPMWYKLGLENKIPVPKMPAGKIVFSRGKIGEDVRKIGLGLGPGPRPTFDLTDPYCNNVSYAYVPMHDPHLAHHYCQKPARNRMKELGFCTKDGRAVCSLKDFNQYRKFLYNLFMDRIHMEMDRLDVVAKDNLMMKRVEVDVARRLQLFIRSERAREHLEKVAIANAAEIAEKKRAAKAQEKKVQDRMKHLAEYNKKLRKERAAKAAEKEHRIKQRVMAAAELEFRRKITMVRQWRINEKKRVNRLKMEKEAKERRIEEEANKKWIARVQSQAAKIQEEDLLLKLYTADMSTNAEKRSKKAQIYAYNTDLELQRLRLANWKALHGGSAAAKKLVNKMACEFEKSKRGAKGMTLELAHELAEEAMTVATSTKGDRLMTLGQARGMMDILTAMPPAPIRILEEMLENTIMEYARRQVHTLLSHIETVVRERAATIFFAKYRLPSSKKRVRPPPRYQVDKIMARTRQDVRPPRDPITFAGSVEIPTLFPIPLEVDPKRTKDRIPTPVPSLMKLTDIVFGDRLEDLPEAVAIGSYLPERIKLIQMINTSAKLLSKNVSELVKKGMDLDTGKVMLPRMRRRLEWGEAVEGLANAVVDHRISATSPDIRQTGEFLSRRVLLSLLAEMKLIKEMQKNKLLLVDGEEEGPPAKT